MIAQLDAKPEFAAQFRAALEPLIAATLTRAGVPSLPVAPEPGEPHSWMLYEEWESEAAPAAPTSSSPIYIAFWPATPGLPADREPLPAA